MKITEIIDLGQHRSLINIENLERVVIMENTDLIEKLNEQLTIPVVVKQSELLVCEHRWINNTHDNNKYCSRGCDGFIKHEAN
tara:strand:+ start:261 stop:509 length:249 start_codon:yes stop_codon:yes gene_type:complete